MILRRPSAGGASACLPPESFWVPPSSQVHDELFGCFSFVDLHSALPRGIKVGDLPAEPALDDDEFFKWQEHLRLSLQGVECTALNW